MLLALRFFSVDDLVLAPLCLLLLYAVIRNRAERNTDPQIKKLYYRGFYFKILCVLAFTYVTEFIFKGGDTSLYYQGIKDLRAAIDADFSHVGTIIKSFKLSMDNPLTPYFYYDNYSDDFIYNYMLLPNNFLIPKLGLLPSVTFFNNYLCINFIFGFFALGGAIRLFKTFHYYFPNYTSELAMATIFLPSVGFWSAGLLKDTVCFGSVGYIIYATLNIFVKKKKIRASLIWIILCAFLIYNIKTYLLLILILSMLIWFFAVTHKLIADRTLRNIFIFLTLVPSCIVGYFLLNYLTTGEGVQQYKIDTFFEQAESHRKVIDDLGKTGSLGSNFSMNTSDPFLLVPTSIFTILFRPFFWEVKSPVALFSALESFFLLFLTLYFFFKRGIRKFFSYSFSDPILLMCFIFSIVFALAVGASTTNFGALSRYRIPCIPFYLIMLLMLYKKTSLSYPKWFYKVLNWIR
jgi:hypothetical protein